MKKILLLPLVLLSCLLQAQTMDYQQFMQRVAAANLLAAADSQSDKLTATAHLWASLGID